MSIFEGFEGQRSPSRDEVVEIVEKGVIALDANVLLDLYSYAPRLRETALKVLTAKAPQLFVPHQALREFWRNRVMKIATRAPFKDPMEHARNEVRAVFNKLDPGSEVASARAEERDAILELLDDASQRLGEAYGDDLDSHALLVDPTQDPVVRALQTILKGRIGTKPGSAELEARIAEGTARAKRRQPPGYMDVDSKKDQYPEHGTGDYLVWREILDHVAATQTEHGFVIVSNDQKEDWRVVTPGSDRRVLGPRPELIEEALALTKCRMGLLATNDFYEMAASSAGVTPADKEALVVASNASETSSRGADSPPWTIRGYTELLETLQDWGKAEQARVIEEASRRDGFISRERIFALLGFDEDRLLVRFSMPANRVRDDLIGRGLVAEGVRDPMRAVYDGPGKAIGYSVPSEFVEFAEVVEILGAED